MCLGAVMLQSNLRVKLLLGYLKNPVPGHYQARVVFWLRPDELQALHPYQLQALPALMYYDLNYKHCQLRLSAAAL